MARYAAKTWDRFSSLLLCPDPSGLVFGSAVAGGSHDVSANRLVDLSDVAVIGTSVDTVRQLYRGVLRPDVLSELRADVEVEGVLWPLPMATMWHISKAPYKSGFTYKLQNNEVGIIVFVKSFYAKDDAPGTHIKIEVSPHFLAQRGVRQVQSWLDAVALHFLDNPQTCGCAVHLACDVQGWSVPSDFMSRFRTRSQASVSFNGASDVEFDFQSYASSYGDNETVMFGKANGLQFTAYRKDREIERSDKVDFMHREWSASPRFDPSAPVVRLEARFHHSVVQEIGRGIDTCLDSFAEVSVMLTDLWRYALLRNRLDYSTVYVDPFWQLLMQDVEFLHPSNGFRISRKKRVSVAPLAHNFSLVVGNLISIGARYGWDARQLLKQMRALHFFDDLLQWYRLRGFDESKVREHLGKALLQRRLVGRAA